MISIYASTKYHQTIQDWIDSEDRLGELVNLVDYLEERPVPNGMNLVIKEQGISAVLDWHNSAPPYLLPEWVNLTKENLLGLVFAKLNNYEKTQAYLGQDNPALYAELDFINRLQQGVPIDPNTLASAYTPYDEYRIMHNQAIIRHYGNTESEEPKDSVKYYYLEALITAPHDTLKAYSGWHFGLFLLDAGEWEDALRVVQAVHPLAGHPLGKNELQYLRAQIGMRQLSPPYAEDHLESLRKDLWEVQQTYEKAELKVNEALALTDMGMIANYSESWAESLQYFQRAIQIFEEQDLTALAAQAQYRKGTLLFTWAQNGNPQFYRPAAESYQAAIKVFNRQDSPDMYAEIQHHLGIIYAEIPDEAKKKGLWAAISSSAFQEALGFYQKKSYPYEYAAVCNHYANALLKYPDAKLSDNVEKALFFFSEALEIRTADQFPMERSLTILNYLEAQWNLGMEEDQLEQDRFDEMSTRAQEVVAICPDPALQQVARQHLEQLENLKTAYAQ